jgi:integrase/recombinase XerD
MKALYRVADLGGGSSPSMFQIMGNVNSELLLLWREWQQAGALSERTINERAVVMSHLFARQGCDGLTMTPGDIIAYCARSGLSATSRGTYHASIRAFTAWMLRTGVRPDNPALTTPTPKRPRGVPRPVPTEDLSLILAQVNRRRTRAMILLAALAGLRVHEIAKFRGEDIDTRTGVITVTGKGGVTAIIPAHSDLIITAHFFPRRGYWFPGYGDHSDRPIAPSSVGSAITAVMKRAGLTATAHQLRHWYATNLLSAGVDLRIVQELMRHASPATTAIYTLVNPEQQKAAIARLKLPSAA